MQGDRRHFGVVSGESAVLIEARSNVGPISFATTSVEGELEATLIGALIDTDVAPRAHLEVRLDTLRSGNKLYDAELLRRVDARAHPVVHLDLSAATRSGRSERLHVTGDLKFHGVSRRVSGTVSVAVLEGERLRVTGEHIFDVRDFDIVAPTVLMLRIYPDVRVQLQLEAEART